MQYKILVQYNAMPYICNIDFNIKSKYKNYV